MVFSRNFGLGKPFSELAQLEQEEGGLALSGVENVPQRRVIDVIQHEMIRDDRYRDGGIQEGMRERSGRRYGPRVENRLNRPTQWPQKIVQDLLSRIEISGGRNADGPVDHENLPTGQDLRDHARDGRQIQQSKTRSCFGWRRFGPLFPESRDLSSVAGFPRDLPGDDVRHRKKLNFHSHHDAVPAAAAAKCPEEFGDAVFAYLDGFARGNHDGD